MARKRIIQEVATGKKWGTVNVSAVTIQGAAGPYIQWRCPYYLPVPYDCNGETLKTSDPNDPEIVGFNKVRRAAPSSLSEQDARQKA